MWKLLLAGLGIGTAIVVLEKKTAGNQQTGPVNVPPLPMFTPQKSVSATSMGRTVQLTPAAPVTVAPVAPQRILGDPIAMMRGALYRTAVTVHFPASLAANVSKVKAEAESEGFTNVQVSTSPFPGWQGATGDYYVIGVYSGAASTIERSHAGGQVFITDVWQG